MNTLYNQSGHCADCTCQRSEYELIECESSREHSNQDSTHSTFQQKIISMSREHSNQDHCKLTVEWSCSENREHSNQLLTVKIQTLSFGEVETCLVRAQLVIWLRLKIAREHSIIKWTFCYTIRALHQDRYAPGSKIKSEDVLFVILCYERFAGGDLLIYNLTVSVVRFSLELFRERLVARPLAITIMAALSKFICVTSTHNQS